MKKGVLATAILLAVVYTGGCLESKAWAEEVEKEVAEEAASKTEEEIKEYTLAKIIVEAKRAEIADGMMTTSQTVGILGDKDILDTPLHQVTFTEKALTTFSKPGRGMLDTLSLDPSVRATQGSMDTSVYIRGISTNGFRWNLNGIPGMTHQMLMPYNFADKVSIISGPSIGITGSSPSMSTQAGGVINMISKKAGHEPNASIKLGWSNDSYFSQEIDVGGRFGKEKEWGIRINAMNANGDLSVDGTKDKLRNIYINIDRTGKHSTTNFLMGYDYDNQYGRSNTINLGNNITNLPSAPKNTKNLSPKWSQDKYENYTLVLNHDQKFSKNMGYFINAGYHKEDYDSWLQQWSGRVLQNMNGDYTGTYTQMPVYHTTHYLGFGIRGNFTMGSLKNNYVIGFDRNWFKRTRDNNVSLANRYPVSGNIYTGSSSARPNVVWDPLTKQYSTKMTGWNIIDTISTADDRVSVTLGVHGHKVDTYNYVDGKRIDSDATSPVLGLVYKFTPNLMFYADHTETFSEGSSVGSGYTNSGELLAPSKTKQNEIGLKFKNGTFLHTLSAFEIKQQNGIAVLNPDSTIRYALDGEQRNRGLEFSSVGDLNKKWSMIFGIAYLQAKQTKTQYGLNDGRKVSGLPSWSGDLALIYKADEKLKLIGRISYTGSTSIRETSSYTSAIKMPSATLFDFGVSYDTKVASHPVTLSFMCYNLFDKNYWYASGANAIGLGAPRTFMLSAKFDF